MNSLIHHRLSVLLATAFLCLTALGGCDDSTTAGPDPNNPNDTASIMLKFNISTMAGTAPFMLDSSYTSESGAEYKVSKLLYYVHALRLVDSAGNDVATTMVNADSTPVPYKTLLVDYRKPESMELRVLVKRGRYSGVRLLLGLPAFDSEGNMLNHIDASTMNYPLNVDADMYWGWKVGYIFLKIEGKARTAGGDWLSIFYHVGDDRRLMPMDLAMPFTVQRNGTMVRTLAVDVNRMFVTPEGENQPNLTGTLEDRTAHSGTMADRVSSNVMGSGFMKLK